MIRELVAAAILLAIAVGYYRAARAIQDSALADDVGPGGVPLAYAVALGAVALALLLRAVAARLLLRTSDSSSAEPRLDRHALSRAAGMLAIGILYLALVGVLGYALMVGIVLLTVALYQGEKLNTRLAAVAVGGALFFWAFFVGLLGVEMPTGAWPLLWGGEWTR